MENENGTIQQDVSTEEKQERPLSNRELMLEQIGSRIDGERQEQEVAPVVQTVEVTTEPAGPKVVEDPASVMVRVKINGKEEEKPLADVLAGYQKNEAASERLRQVAVKEKELSAKEQELEEIKRQIQLQTAQSSDEDTDEVLRTAVSALVEGDLDTATKALQEAISKGRTPQVVTTPQRVDEDALVDRVEQKLDGKKAWGTFLENNPVFADENSRERKYGDFLFETKYDALMRSGEISYQQALIEVAKEVKETLAPPPPQKTAREVKQERKQSLDVLPIAAGARQAGAVEEKEETHASVISDMRKSRGLPV
jgi:hypothetical protein